MQSPNHRNALQGLQMMTHIMMGLEEARAAGPRISWQYSLHIDEQKSLLEALHASMHCMWQESDVIYMTDTPARAWTSPGTL